VTNASSRGDRSGDREHQRPTQPLVADLSQQDAGQYRNEGASHDRNRPPAEDQPPPPTATGLRCARDDHPGPGEIHRVRKARIGEDKPAGAENERR